MAVAKGLRVLGWKPAHPEYNRIKLILNLLIASLVFFGSSDFGKADVILASGAKPRLVIVRQADATTPEQTAVRGLADNLQKITGATFQVLDSKAAEFRDRTIILAWGAALPEFAVDTRTLPLTMWVNATRPCGRQWFNRRSVRWIQLPEIKFPGGSDANGASRYCSKPMNPN
mgnify:CR=1 FL=1